jgi:hypothetical protein
VEPQAEVKSFTRVMLGRGQYGSPRPPTLEHSDEPFLSCAPPRWRVDTRDGGRIYRWAGCRRIAVYVWKQSIGANGFKRREDSFSFLFERDRNYHTAIAPGGGHEPQLIS